MKYAHIDENGKILGWYSDDIHGTFVKATYDEDGQIIKDSYYDISKIPTPNIEVTEKVWQEAINKNANAYDKVSKSFIVKDFRTLEDIRKQKLNDINSSCDKAIVSGFTSEALGSKHFYYSTLEEQSTLNSLINLGVDNQFKAQKITLVDGIETKEARKAYPHTIQQLRDVLADGFTHIATQVVKKDTLEAEINREDITVEELEAISWEA